MHIYILEAQLSSLDELGRPLGGRLSLRGHLYSVESAIFAGLLGSLSTIEGYAVAVSAG